MKYWFMSAAAALMVAASQTQAAETPDTKPAADSGALNDIVVTAQRREQSAQSVGVALTVLSGQDLINRGVTNVNQLQYSTPNLSVTPAFGSGQPNFRLRGVGFDDYASNNTSTVGIYVDEVAYPLPIQTQGLLFDISRVEVLRGPQGTLYGRNTTGGAVNFVTNRPTDGFHAGAEAEFGNYDSIDAQGYVSGPIAQTLQGRLSVQTVQGGGWQHNRVTGQSLGDADKTAVRGQLQWEATPALTFLLNVHWAQDHSEPTGLYLFKPLGGIAADTDHTKTGWGGSSAFASLIGTTANGKPFRRNDSEGVDLTANWDLGGAKLTSVTAYENLNRQEYNDWDASSLAYAGVYFGSKVKVFSQELRISSPDSSKIKWVGGLYYDHEDLDEAFISDFQQSLGFITDTSYKQKAQSYSLFGQAELPLTNTLSFVVGARVEHEQRSFDNFKTAVVGAGAFATGSPSTHYTEGTGKLELEYKPSTGVLYYASASRGVKSGGMTAYNSLSDAQLQPFAPEVLWAYEVGFKRDYPAQNLRVNGAAYYYDYVHQQVQSAIYDPVYGAVGVIRNADAHIYGGELEVQWRPLPNLEIDQSLGYSTGEFTRFQDLDITASGAAGHAVYVSRKGQTEGYPHLSYTGSASYTFDIGDYALVAGTDYAYHDKVEPTLLGSTFNVAAYWLVNANLTLKPQNGPWTVGLWGRNIFDTKYDLTRNFFLSGVDIAAPGTPATYGVRLSYKY
ncbi:MAG: TonB-dependent receptor [Caulobacteraceae bacterium]|nr:TonB-dependent receptor [Caulobacteraceae bacterium]